MWPNKVPAQILIVALTAVTSISSTTALADTATDAESARKQTVSVFLEKLRLVADSGKLIDPHATGKTLQLSFDSTSKEQEPQPPDCSTTMGLKSRLLTTHTLSTNDWYKATANGVKEMQIPGFTINPAYRIDESHQPTLAYTSFRILYCGDPVVTLRENIETNLLFSTLPRFACITASDIVSVLPEARYREATDGVSHYVYNGQQDAIKATKLQFTFRAFAACTLEATIQQSTRDGLRFKKVDYEFRSCRNKAMEVYRKDHPPVVPTNIRDTDGNTEYGKDVVASEKFVREQCGTFEQLYYGHKQ